MEFGVFVLLLLLNDVLAKFSFVERHIRSRAFRGFVDFLHVLDAKGRRDGFRRREK